ncbi:hypothetical protein LTR24_002159 [Lithohypha guttulata]|uniref:serine C-palmitoyltransferase n=1 Tax=Lithohypha guttulata TaxID=1690604 RepID=A0ABR0KKT4_9EURO|nr:hypothetical protein LTR24_002159 [Lithohypha guttulata]
MAGSVARYRLGKSNSHERPVVVEIHETGSVASEEESLEKPLQPRNFNRRRASRCPKATAWAKTQEAATLAYSRAKVLIKESETNFQPLSKAEVFNRYYIEPHLGREGKNQSTMLGRCRSKVEVKDGRGKTQNVIHAASHNYAGLYEQDSTSEELQRLCLDSFPLADSTAASRLNEAFCRRISSLLETDFCCTTGTGYGSNLLAFPAVLGKEWLVVFDEKCHNSMYVGAYQSDVGLILKFKHNNMEQLEAILQEYNDKYNVLVAVEGAYSMDGTVPQLDRLAQLKQRYDCTILADEAHSLLTLGTTGKGCVEMWNESHPNSHIPLGLFDIRTATMSKAFGAIGGIVCGNSKFEKAILNRQGMLLANASEPLTPPAIVQSLHVLGQPSRLQRNLSRLRATVKFVRGELERAGIYVYGNAVTPVLPIHTGRPSLACALSYVLRQHDILALPIATPAVPMWEARVRVCLSAGLDDDTVNRLVDGLIRCCQIVGIIGKTQSKLRIFAYQDNAFAAEEIEALDSQRYIENLITQDKATSPGAAKTATLLLQAGHAARRRYGIASGAPRWTAGTYGVHLEVEKSVAKLAGVEDTMTFGDSYIALMSTIAALYRPLLAFKKHYFFIPRKAPAAVMDGLKVAPKNGAPTTKYYDSAEALLYDLKVALDKKIYVTLYLDSGFESTTTQLHKGLRKLCHSKKFSGMTILLDCHERPEHVPQMDIVKTAECCGAQLAVYGSFSRTYALSGAYVAGRKQLISELRYTSRGYMFTTSQLPFVMGMVAEALKGGKELA